MIHRGIDLTIIDMFGIITQHIKYYEPISGECGCFKKMKSGYCFCI